ncbi:MAG: hypothetical protein J3Q66DRAFT_405874 [Benniella sp.]|nr:MAG: hypothetical protein J3Q66DRAFT_405874 [Benniella sp.]
MLERFLKEALPSFLATHERHGRNGHYIGDKVPFDTTDNQPSSIILIFCMNLLSLPDIKLSIAVNIILGLTGDQHVSKDKTPAIWAVYEAVNAIPSIGSTSPPWLRAFAQLLLSLSIEEALVQSIAAALGVESEQSIEGPALEVGQQHMLPPYRMVHQLVPLIQWPAAQEAR